MQSDAILKVRNLKTVFKVGHTLVNAVNGVSFDLERGHTLGIVGESGCGKSVTTASILQLLPKHGSVVEGTVEYIASAGGDSRMLSSMKKDSEEIRMVRGKEIAMIFQDPSSSLNPLYTVGSQISENLLRHESMRKDDARKRIVALLADLGISNPEQRYDEYPHQFSGGMKQRIMIAIAMVCNPSILIADEPTTALDTTIQAQILSLMTKLKQEHNTSIILITHNMGVVAETCDEVAVMYMGRIVEFGSLQQIFERPLHPYTKALLRSVPVLGIDRNIELETIKGSTPDASIGFDHCEFEPRCDKAFEPCRTGFPLDTVAEDGRLVRCRLYEGWNSEP